jgi:hypothetical protein
LHTGFAYGNTSSSPVSFSHKLDAGLRIGLSMQESSLNDGSFETGFITGPDFSFRFLKLKSHFIGITAGFFHFFNERKGGTQMMNQTTKYNRLDFSADFTANIKAFTFTAGPGAGLMIIKTKTSYQKQYRETSGISAGFLLKGGIGINPGYWFKNKSRRFAIMAVTDWLRRKNRDELTLWALINVNLF